MEYKTGFKIKPFEVNGIGEVLFTNGTVDTIIPNQVQCEAYGYNYDGVSGTCRAFRYTPLIPSNVKNSNNRINGPGNSSQLGSNTIQINGTSNSTSGENNNCFINGSESKVSRDINNAAVIGGSLGEAVRQGEVVVGGGLSNGFTGVKKFGLSQSSVIQLSVSTTDATTTSLNVQNLPSAFIEMQKNSILGFEIYVTRLETGGTSGTAGNFHYLVIKGAARCQGSTGAITLYTYSTTTIASLGSAAITPAVMYDSSTGGIPSITIQVTDLANRDNVWSATAYLHELRTITTF
tara:strand:- start:668 stop:1543 length:876 start_codon:yes stop_codon:yes gene_type:complete